jgi:signal transduction histidine kinase
MEGGGLVQYDGETDILTRYVNEPGNPMSLSDDVVLSLYEDSSGVLWIGTTNGLNELRPGETDFRRHMFPNDPSLNLVLAVIGDSNDNLWLTTSKGLVQYSPLTRDLSLFGRPEGLAIDDPSSGAIVRTREGRIYIGGSSGVAGFHPDSILKNNVAPAIVITNMNVMGRHYDAQPEVRLSYEQNSVSFEFAALDFTSPEKNEYSYLLEGFDHTWTRSGTRRYASYTNLDPGDYHFRVRGSNSDGVWGTDTASVAIVITPPFWERWWFRIGVILFAVAVLTIIHRYRMAQLLRVERLRLRIASDLHDDIGSKLSSIALMGDVVRKRSSRPSDVQNEISTISRFARQMVSELKDIVWVIDPENDSMEDFLQRMKNSTEELLSGIEYSLNLDHRNAGTVVEMETRRNLLLIYKELLHNIVQHARATHVDITFEYQENGITLLVADNGRGCALESIHEGNGTKTIRRRAAQLQGTIEMTSSPGAGTSVLVRIPNSRYGQMPLSFLTLRGKPSRS